MHPSLTTSLLQNLIRCHKAEDIILTSYMRAFFFVLFLAVIQCLDFCETETSWTLVSFYACNVHHGIFKMANFLLLFRADRYIINVTCLVNFMDFVLGSEDLNKYVAY